MVFERTEAAELVLENIQALDPLAEDDRLFAAGGDFFEVGFEATLWGTGKELREVIALAETGRLRPIPIELASLDDINDVYARVKGGKIQGRVVIRPAA